MPSLTGEAQRESKRKEHIENVTIKAKYLFNEAFKQADLIHTEAEFLTCWSNFEAQLMSTFGQQKDYRQAFKCGEYQLKTLKSSHKWSYSPPSTIITNRPVKQTRQPAWLKHSWSLYDQYEEWRLKMAKDITDIHLRYQSLMLSFIFESGQQSSDVVKAFNLLISSNAPLNLKQFSCYTYLPLIIEGNKCNTNSTRNGERITEYLCYLSIHTLGQLKLWQDTIKSQDSMHQWQAPDNNKEIYRRIIVEFSNPQALPNGLNTLCSCAASWYERKINPLVSQALLDIRSGRTATYSLPESNLIQVLQPTINMPESASFYQFRHEVNIPSRQSSVSTSLNASTLPLSDFFSELKIAFKRVSGRKLSPDTLRTALNALLTEYALELWQIGFVQWLLHKLTHCKPSTVNSYQCALLKDWIYMNTQYSLDCNVTADALAEIYQDQINRHGTEKTKQNFTARLKDFHAYAVVSLGLPLLDDDFFHCDATQKHTRAGVVDESLFKALLVHINILTDINEADKLALQTLCILSYRCGLRMVELYKLQMGNVSECEETWIDIRSNELGDNKTASGLRSIFVIRLLLADEKEIVERYLRHKRMTSTMKSDPLLTMGDDIKQPFYKVPVSNYVGQMLKVTSGLDHLVFHHLRHSCLSRLQIMLEMPKPKELLPHLYPYDEVQNQRIKSLLFKKTYQQGYSEIAAFAGHETPSMTFAYYFHFSDFLAAPHRDAYLKPIEMNESLNSGVFTHDLYWKMHKKHSPVKLAHGYKYLIGKLNITQLGAVQETLGNNVTLLPNTNSPLSFDLCYQVLVSIAGGRSINDLVFKYQLQEETISKWIENVTYIKSLKPGNDGGANNSRFFPSNRQHALTPGVLTRVEKKYITLFNQKLRDHYPTHKQEFTTQMHYYLHHVCVSRAGIRFTCPTLLANFIAALSFAIPKSHWRAVTDNMRSSTQKEEWDKVLKGIDIDRNCDGTTTGRTGLGSVNLELKDPSEQSRIEKGTVRKYSTSLLKTLMFYAFVMIGNAKSDDDDLLHSDE